VGDPLWDDNGHWVGPRQLRLFLRLNWFFAAFWQLVVTSIALAFWFDVVDISSWLLALPLALVSGALVTLGFMFAFSRGWIADGD
jgi:hypothetical protein